MTSVKQSTLDVVDKIDGRAIHPAAELFPVIDGEGARLLAEDIKANGLREEIVLFEEKVLDGRNRYRACLRAGILPRFVTWNGSDPITYVLSKNLRRRHLNESQRAMVAAHAKYMYEGLARERQRQGGCEKLRANLPEARARDQAAELVNVSPRSVQDAAAVLKSGNAELAAAVSSGEVAVSAAAAIVRGKASARGGDPVGRILQAIGKLTPGQRTELWDTCRKSGVL